MSDEAKKYGIVDQVPTNQRQKKIIRSPDPITTYGKLITEARA